MEEEFNKQLPVEIQDRIYVLQNREQELRKNYEKCIAWRVRYFSALTLMSVPISIWTKRYTPLCAGAVIGSAADAWEAKKKCGAIADELDDVIDEKERLEKNNQ